VAEGEFHESLNLAKLWRLPVLFICENNLYAMGTALAVSHSVTDLASKAQAYDIPSQTVDGMDVLAIEAAAKDTVERVRQGGGPEMLELRTYRFRGHSLADPQLYRSQEEVEAWKAHDPIPAFAERLLLSGLLDEAAQEEIESIVQREVDDAVEFAEASPWPPIESLMDHVGAL
jgi:TPP-dependent pyruvate/acetoin dehydrogenase alpha subunit